MTYVKQTTVYRWPDSSTTQDLVACEEPLELRVEGKPMVVTMRTPGHDIELAAGFLYSEGVVDGLDDFAAIDLLPLPEKVPSNVVDCVLAGGVSLHAEALQRATRGPIASSSCGLCGKTQIQDILRRIPKLKTQKRLTPEEILPLPKRLSDAQVGFKETGGLHGAGLFDFDGTLEVIREDIGRHNAVDKIIGYRLLEDNVPIDDRILVISSRASFEIVQKAANARIPVIVAMGAASSLAIELANDVGMALYGFVGGTRFNQYSPLSSLP